MSRPPSFRRVFAVGFSFFIEAHGSLHLQVSALGRKEHRYQPGENMEKTHEVSLRDMTLKEREYKLGMAKYEYINMIAYNMTYVNHAKCQ